MYEMQGPRSVAQCLTTDCSAIRFLLDLTTGPRRPLEMPVARLSRVPGVASGRYPVFSGIAVLLQVRADAQGFHRVISRFFSHTQVTG